jgi:hypothetical protein
MRYQARVEDVNLPRSPRPRSCALPQTHF